MADEPPWYRADWQPASPDEAPAGGFQFALEDGPLLGCSVLLRDRDAQLWVAWVRGKLVARSAIVIRALPAGARLLGAYAWSPRIKPLA